MDHSLKAFDHIRYNRLPLKYEIMDDFVLIDCSSWDISEIDDMIMTIGGTREGFIVKIGVENGIYTSTQSGNLGSTTCN